MIDALREVAVTGAVRLAAASGSGEPVESLLLDDREVVVNGSRRVDLATLGERPSKPVERPPPPAIALEEQERILTVAPEHGLAVSTVVTARGTDVLLRSLRTTQTRRLAVEQRPTVAASISPDGKGVIILDEEGRVLRYDASTSSYPASARARKPEPGKRACVDLAPGGRLWLAAAGAFVEVRLMSDGEPIATVDLSPATGEVTRALFLSGASGVLVGTARGVVLRFELLHDRVGSSREARIAAIADAVDAALAGTSWNRYSPSVEVYDERTDGDRTTLYFVADRYEYHYAQSGSDWAEHDLCAGHATFEGERRIGVEVTSIDRRRLSERQDESYEPSAALAAFREASARARGAV